MFTLLAIVCLAAVLCLFSQEIVRLLKKIFAFKGATTLLPLALASSLIYYNPDLILIGVYYIHAHLKELLQWIMYLIPYKNQAYSIALVIELTIVSVVPVLLLDLYSYKQTHKPYPHPYLTSTLLWLISAMLLVVL